MDWSRLTGVYEAWLATNPSPADDPAFLTFVNDAVAIPRTSITGDELLEAAVLAEVAALVDAGQRAFWALVGKDRLDVSAGSNTRALLSTLFGAGTTTRANLVALITTDIQSTRAAEEGLEPVGQPHLDRLRLDGRI